MKVNPDVYTVGGTVQAGNGVYISRAADEELLALCRASVYTYVLTPRQMGKSSLMIRTAQQLALENIKSAYIDLTKIVEKDISADQFYLGILTILRSRLKLKINVIEWWKARHEFSRPQRFTDFIEEIVLAEIQEPVVVFIDEIDKTIGLDFSDDFFASIRSLFQDRTRLAQLRRISFVLVGVATPSDLIKDEKTTPFNIGKRVELSDFTTEEGRPLIAGLGLPEESAIKVLDNVYKWTNGHPYLTQRLFRTLVDENPASWTESEIDSITAKTFFGEESEKDNNLQFVRDMLTHSDRVADSESILTTYREILRGKTPVYDDEQSLVISHLKLSGVVCNKGGVLQVRNEIYRQVFNEEWIKRHINPNWKRRLAKAATVAAGLFFIGLIPLSVFAFYKYWDAETQRQFAEVKKNEAENNYQYASEQKEIAERNAKLATQSENRAKNSEAETKLALEKERQAKKQIENLVIQEREAKKRVETARLEAEKQTLIATNARDEARKAQERAEMLRDEAKKQENIATDAMLRLNVSNKQLQKVNEELEDKKNEAERSAAEAKSSAQDAEKYRQVAILGLRAQQIERTNPEASILLATESLKVSQSINKNPSEVNADLALRRGLFSLPLIFANPTSARSARQNDSVNSAWFAASSNILVTASDRTLRFSSDAKNRAATEIIYPSPIVKTFDFSNSKPEFIVTLNQDNRVYVLYLYSRKINFLPEAGEAITLNERNEKDVWQSFAFEDIINDLAVSPKGDRIAVAHGDKIQFIRFSNDIFAQDDSAFVHKPDKEIKSVAFSPDGRFIVKADGDAAWIWDAENNSIISQIKSTDEQSTDEQITSAIFSPDGRLIATAGADSKVRVWSVSNGQQIIAPTEFEKTAPSSAETKTSAPPLGYRRFINDLQFSPDSRSLAVASSKSVSIYPLNADGESSLTRKEVVLKIPADESGTVSEIQFSPDGRYIATGKSDGRVNLWEASTGNIQARMKHDGEVNSISFSEDGRYLTTSSADRTARVWDLTGGRDLSRPFENGSPIIASAFNKNKQFLATVGNDRNLKLWNARTKEVLKTFKLDAEFNGGNTIAFSSSGSFLAAAQSGEGGSILRIIDTRTGEIKTLGLTSARVKSISFNRDDSFAIFATDIGTVNILNMKTAIIKPISAEAVLNPFIKALFNPKDDSTAVILSSDGRVELWKNKNETKADEETFALLWSANVKNASDITFDPKGGFIAVSSDSEIRILNADTGKEVTGGGTEINFISSINWTEDGNFLAAAGGNYAEIWSVAGLYEGNQSAKVSPIRRFSNIVHNFEKTVDITGSRFIVLGEQSYLATAGTDGLVRLWLWKPGDLINDACNRLTRNLTNEEWKKYIDNGQPPPNTCVAR